MIRNKSAIRKQAKVVAKDKLQKIQDDHNPFKDLPVSQTFLEQYDQAIRDYADHLGIKIIN